MKLKFLTLFLVITCLVFAKGKGDIVFPDGLGIAYYGHDTTYYSPDSLKSIWKIKMGNKVYAFSPFGNLTSISEIKEAGVFDYIDTNKKEYKYKTYVLDGISFLFYDDSTRTLAGIGEFNSNKEGENWKYFDRKGRLTELTYHMPLWTRHDYYDTIGKLSKEADYTASAGDDIKVREVIYTNGHQKIILNKMLIDIFILHFMGYYLGLFFFFLFSRVVFNVIIYTREGTKFEVYFGIFYTILLASLYSFWFSNYKPENRRLVVITNTFSIIAGIMFFGLIILSIINGDIS